MLMTGHNPKREVLRGREVRRRRAPAEKLAIIAGTMEAGMSGSHVARRHGIAPNQWFAAFRLSRFQPRQPSFRGMQSRDS